MKGVKSQTPLTSSYKFSMAAEGSFPSNFRYYSEFEVSLHHQKIKFSVFDYIILDKNYYDKT